MGTESDITVEKEAQRIVGHATAGAKEGVDSLLGRCQSGCITQPVGRRAPHRGSSRALIAVFRRPRAPFMKASRPQRPARPP